MTISSSVRKVGPFTGTGTVTVFTFDFKVFQRSDLYVVKADSDGIETVLVLNTDYTASLNSNQDSNPGGSITLASALASGYTMIISSTVGNLQPTDLTNQGGFYPSVITDALDRATIQIQQIQEQVDRSAKLPITNDTDADELLADILLLANNKAELDVLYANINDIQTVAADLNEPVSEINTVAGSIANVDAVGSNITNVNTVAGNTTNINTVSGISGNVTTVAGISGNVTTVAGISANVTAVANNATNINAVNANKANIDAVAGNNTNITAVAGNATNINAVNANKTNIDTVAGKATEVTTVAGIAGNVTTVAGISANVTAVANNSSNINAVAGNATNINAVNANKANIDTVAGISSNVNTVAGISGDVTTVADNVADVTNFADVYLGARTADPTTRTDGSALHAGDLYFNTTVGELRVYSGSQWVAGTAGTMAVQRFSGDNSTVAFTLATAPAGENNTQVYINGVYQQKDAYGVSGVTLTFSSAPPLGTDNIEVVTISTLALGETDASLVSFLQDGTGAVQRTVQDELRERVSVKQFGAVGDGVTNDTDAFAAASAYITSQGGGTLVIPPGTYIVGKQTFAGATGKGYSYQAADIINITNCTKPVIIEGNGAILKAADGLKFGSFDPVTGEVYNPGSLPFTNYDYAAQAYWGMVQATGNANITIKDLELNGNIANLTLGGYFGDTGRQVAAYGVRAYANQKLKIENVYTHHHGLDGVAVGYEGLTDTSPQYPQTLINVVSEYNARQGLSWVGGTQLTAIDCKFNHTGKSSFGSSPSAGVDIEAESSVCRNGLFINCEMQNNTGVGMLADSGDSADVVFLRCKFIGQSRYPIWPQKPRLSFIDCTIIGSYVNSYASATKPEDATKYQRCLFTDESKYAATLYGIGILGSLLSVTSGQNNVLYDSCAFIVTRAKAGRFDASILRNCTFDIQAGTSYCADKDWHMIVWSATLENVSIKDNISVGVPANAYYIGQNGHTSETYRGHNILTSASNKIKWFNWSWGHTGLLYNSYQAFQGIYLGSGRNGLDTLITLGTAAPTTGTYNAGDRVLNGAPAVGQPKGWICTVGGTPGTWISEGNL